ncbi:prepilin-type cleavage/methylation domain-containing protein [Leptospira perolatii]|uniref:Prepilin-type cleavage/methylation domain-containing protein n=1 Tax=Leptospira perolatii TaxID=2023191 RepID=A0A2M9ZIG2_9LEPT|nr:type II secretion system protein [Leptospira perolatii]PJZ68527.1 prepilin-type cleavage/methylation domain-containing protein [Leptospira perolatii]PJZ71857.1 prepilin-type cleavage/methylation domain-containing protein [Leptospira perolatii]
MAALSYKITSHWNKYLSQEKKSRKRTLSKSRRSGFTLIEMVIAMTIAITWIAYVLLIVGEGIRMRRLAAVQSQAVHLAKIKIAQIDSASVLQADKTSGDIPGFKGFKFETLIKEEEINLLELSGNKGKKPEDLLGGSDSAASKLIQQRSGNNQGSATGGMINVFHIFVTIHYPTGTGTSAYTVETFKARQF